MTGVTISCFALSYLIAFAFELTRHVFRVPYRMALISVLALIGIVTHGLYLGELAIQQASQEGSRAVLASWQDWCLIAAFGMGLCYIFILFRRIESTTGSFLLPLILGLIATGLIVRNQPGFARQSSSLIWPAVHGVSLLVGTMLLALGFVMGVMYFIHAWRLKQRKLGRRVLRLPSLEYTQKLGGWCLYGAAICVAMGLASGVLMNLQGEGGVANVQWDQSGILFSGILGTWLGIASIINLQVVGSARGRITAWLCVTSFLAFLLALWLIMQAPHGQSPDRNSQTIPHGQSSVSGRGTAS